VIKTSSTRVVSRPPTPSPSRGWEGGGGGCGRGGGGEVYGLIVECLEYGVMEQRPMCWGIMIGIDIDGYRLAVYKGHLLGIAKVSMRLLHFTLLSKKLNFILFFIF
jgi:hypothetical protein